MPQVCSIVSLISTTKCIALSAPQRSGLQWQDASSKIHSYSQDAQILLLKFPGYASGTHFLQYLCPEYGQFPVDSCQHASFVMRLVHTEPHFHQHQNTEVITLNARVVLLLELSLASMHIYCCQMPMIKCWTYCAQCQLQVMTDQASAHPTGPTGAAHSTEQDQAGLRTVK